MNWSSEPWDLCEALDDCESAEELESALWCKGRLGVGNGSLQE